MCLLKIPRSIRGQRLGCLCRCSFVTDILQLDSMKYCAFERIVSRLYYRYSWCRSGLSCLYLPFFFFSGDQLLLGVLEYIFPRVCMQRRKGVAHVARFIYNLNFWRTVATAGQRSVCGQAKYSRLRIVFLTSWFGNHISLQPLRFRTIKSKILPSPFSLEVDANTRS